MQCNESPIHSLSLGVGCLQVPEVVSPQGGHHGHSALVQGALQQSSYFFWTALPGTRRVGGHTPS